VPLDFAEIVCIGIIGVKCEPVCAMYEVTDEDPYKRPCAFTLQLRTMGLWVDLTCRPPFPVCTLAVQLGPRRQPLGASALM
jgi:hypothetical protein